MKHGGETIKAAEEKGYQKAINKLEFSIKLLAGNDPRRNGFIAALNLLRGFIPDAT